MAVTINSANQITLTGGTAGTPLLMTHLTTLANWPSGTTQATVDSYITKTVNSYTFNIKAGKTIMCQGYLDQSDATIKHEGTNSYIIADNGGVITGGKYVNGKVFGRTSWLFDIGAQSSPQPASSNQSFLRGSGQINMIGLRILNNSQQPGATGIVFWAGSTGSFNLQDLEILSEGNSPVYATFNTDNSTAGSSSVSIREARVGAISHSTQNVTLSFIEGGGGWIGGDNGSTKNKLLIPTTQTTYVGLAPVFQNTNDIINITNKDFGSPSFVAKNAQLEKGRITMYPNTTTNRAEIKRTFNFKIQNLSGSQVNNTKVRATSQRIVTTGGVPASAITTQLLDAEFNYNGNQDITVWLGTGARSGTGDGTYLLPNIITDDTNVSLLFRHLSCFEQTASTNSELGSATFTNALVPDTYYTSETAIPAEVVFIKATKTIDLSALSTTKTIDQFYDYCKVFLKANMEVVNFLTPTGTNINVADWNVIGLEKLTEGTKLKSLQSTGTITANGTIANLSIVGNVNQSTPTNLTNVTISGTLTYNTNTDTSITLTNTTIGTVENIGTGIVIINNTNSAITNYVDAEINFIDSSISIIGADSVTIHPTANDRNLNQNISATFTSNYAFKYGSLVNGTLLSGTLYLRCLSGVIPFNVDVPITLGDTVQDLGMTALLSALSSKIDSRPTLAQIEASDILAKKAHIETVNRNTIKASKLIPASEDIN